MNIYIAIFVYFLKVIYSELLFVLAYICDTGAQNPSLVVLAILFLKSEQIK